MHHRTRNNTAQNNTAQNNTAQNNTAQDNRWGNDGVSDDGAGKDCVVDNRAGNDGVVEDSVGKHVVGMPSNERVAAVTMHVEFCGEWTLLQEDVPFTIGRGGDLQVDDNPYLHRHFLQIERRDGLWWLANTGSQLTATVSDTAGSVQAFLAPGARLPLVFATTTVLFTAGPTTYELTLVGSEPPFQVSDSAGATCGDTTIGPVLLTDSQKAVIVALSEPLLRREGTGTSAIPSSKEAAARLGWEMTRFNRKLDNVCDKLDRRGIRGLRGGPGQLATNRRARLVEHAVASRLVTAEDLHLLELAL